MKKLSFVKVVLLSGLMVFWVAPMAMADTFQAATVDGYGPYQTGRGGEFTFHPLPNFEWVLNAGYVEGITKDVVNIATYGKTFQTFCVESTEYVYANTTFDVTLSQGSVYTDHALTLGAAWLYEQFQLGTLANYAYSGSAPDREASAVALQNTIWYYMGITKLDDGSTVTPDAYYESLGDYHGGFGENKGQIPVAVMNLWVPGQDYTSGGARQDMLVCTPEPTIMLLLGSGLIGLAGLRKKFKK